MKHGHLTLTLAASAAVIASAAPTLAAPVTVSNTYTVGSPAGDIPDNDSLGLTFSQTLSSTGIQNITKVEVGLKMKGESPSNPGFAGDMLVYLNKGAQTSILLNRVGIDLEEISETGFFYDGWDVTFADDALSDIHTTDSTVTLTGTFQPDGRATPLTLSPRDQLLSVFNGGGADGQWNLFVADLGSTATMFLESWTLTIIGDSEPLVAAVPEPSTYAAGAVLSLAVARWFRNRRDNRA